MKKSDAQCISYGIVQVHGLYASRTQFVEVLIDQNYMGVYVVMEKLKEVQGQGRHLPSLSPKKLLAMKLPEVYS